MLCRRPMIRRARTTAPSSAFVAAPAPGLVENREPTQPPVATNTQPRKPKAKRKR
jgi:hypothetical protein